MRNGSWFLSVEDEPEADAAETARARLKASLVRYDRPFEPVLPVEEWEMNR
jgi:hypothetical protein